MASSGEITRDTFVWTAGQDGWKKAEDVQELAQLFTIFDALQPQDPIALNGRRKLSSMIFA